MIWGKIPVLGGYFDLTFRAVLITISDDIDKSRSHCYLPVCVFLHAVLQTWDVHKQGVGHSACEWRVGPLGALQRLLQVVWWRNEEHHQRLQQTWVRKNPLCVLKKSYIITCQQRSERKTWETGSALLIFLSFNVVGPETAGDSAWAAGWNSAPATLSRVRGKGRTSEKSSALSLMASTLISTAYLLPSDGSPNTVAVSTLTEQEELGKVLQIWNQTLQSVNWNTSYCHFEIKFWCAWKSCCCFLFSPPSSVCHLHIMMHWNSFKDFASL